MNYPVSLVLGAHLQAAAASGRSSSIDRFNEGADAQGDPSFSIDLIQRSVGNAVDDLLKTVALSAEFIVHGFGSLCVFEGFEEGTLHGP